MVEQHSADLVAGLQDLQRQGQRMAVRLDSAAGSDRRYRSSDSAAGLVTLATAVFNQYQDLTQRLHDNDGFPAGTWPAITAGSMSDGSITDGDGTDWQLRY